MTVANLVSTCTVRPTNCRPSATSSKSFCGQITVTHRPQTSISVRSQMSVLHRLAWRSSPVIALPGTSLEKINGHFADGRCVVQGKPSLVSISDTQHALTITADDRFVRILSWSWYWCDGSLEAAEHSLQSVSPVSDLRQY